MLNLSIVVLHKYLKKKVEQSVKNLNYYQQQIILNLELIVIN